MKTRIVLFVALPLVVLFVAGSASPVGGAVRAADSRPPIPLPVWRAEPAASGVALTGHGMPGMALDPDGQPHIVYGGNQLYHAWLSDGTWQTELVDPTAGSISGPVIAIDDTGVITIVTCFVRCERPVVQLTIYQHVPGGEWQITPVPGPGLTEPPSLALALDSGGRPHLFAAAGALLDARLTPTGWVTTGVPVGVAAGGPIALALDSHDQPGVLYQGGVGPYSRGILWLARQSSAGWTYEQLAYASILKGKSLAFDSADRVHVAFSDYSEGFHMTYMVQTAAGWQLTEMGIGRSPSLALDASDRPHILFSSDEYGRALLCTVLGPGGWQDSVLSLDEHRVGGSNTLLLDDAGVAHAASLNSGDSLSYATDRSGNWAMQTVAVDDPMGWQHAMALAAADVPHLLYYRPAAQELRLAVRNGGQWTTSTVASVAADGLELALALGPNGVDQVAFLDGQNDRLVVGQANGAAWSLETVTTAGRNLVLVVGQDNRPQLIQIVDDQVVYWTKVAGHWVSEPVSLQGAVATDAFLALDGEDRPHIVFQGSMPATMAVRQSAGVWEKETLDTWPALAMGLGQEGQLYLLVERTEEMRGAPQPILQFIVSLQERIDGQWSISDLGNYFAPIDETTERVVVDAAGRVAVAYRNDYSVTACSLRDLDGQWSSCSAGDLRGDVGLAIGQDHLPRLSGHVAGDLLFLRREILLLDHHALLPSLWR